MPVTAKAATATTVAPHPVPLATPAPPPPPTNLPPVAEVTARLLPTAPSMWIRSDDKKKIRRASADIINEVNKLKSIGDLDEKKQEEAMRLIKAAEQLKEIKVAWATTEASIQEAGGAGCLSCVSCRHQFTHYSNWNIFRFNSTSKLKSRRNI